jgi:hypothetical protein
MKESLIKYVTDLPASKIQKYLLKLAKLHSSELDDKQMHLVRMSKRKFKRYKTWDESKFVEENRDLEAEVKTLTDLINSKNSEILRLFEKTRISVSAKGYFDNLLITDANSPIDKTKMLFSQNELIKFTESYVKFNFK